MNTLTRLRPKFLARPRREKLLLAAFLTVFGVVWLSSFFGRAQTLIGRVAAVNRFASDQQGWLDDQMEIESSFDASMATLREAPLPPVQQVTAGIQALLKKHSIGYTLPSPDRIESDGLAINTFTIRINSASFPNLYSFHQEIASVLPTVNIAEIELRSSTNRGNQPNPDPPLTARVQLVAVEINR